MDNTYSFGRRVLSVAVVALTTLWAAGAAAFAVPQTASAASAGDIIRGTSLSTVYYYGYDGSRYVFPNEKTYDTWFNGFSGVETMSDSAIENISLASENIAYRPGSRWIKITSAAETYAVGRDGAIHWVESEAVATDLAGSDWNQSIDDVPDVYFQDYTPGVSLDSARLWDGALYMMDGNYYVSWDGESRMLNSAARSANAFETRFFLDGEGFDDSDLTAGDDVTGFLCELSDAAQSGDCSSVVTPIGGDLMVSVASTTPASMAIPDTANRVAVTTWKFTADEATTLTGLTTTLGGLVDTDDISNVYLYEGDARLTEERSVNSSTRTATFGGLNLAFAAGQTRYLTAVVDMADNAENKSFRFGIASADNVIANGDVNGSFPAWGNSHSTVAVAVGAITVDSTGSLSNPTLGESGFTVAKFDLDATTAEDIDVHGITLNIDDADDHSNFKLYQNNNMVATGENIGSDLVLFTFDTPYLLEDGATRVFEVRLDVGGESGDTISTYLESVADVEATGRDYGFGVTVTNSYASGESSVTIQGGEVTLAFNGPFEQDVRTGAENHTFLEFSITSEEWIEVDQIVVNVDHTDGGAATSDLTDQPLTDIRLINAETGALVAGSEELATGGGTNDQDITFTDNFYVEAGETLRLAVTADVESDADAADVFTFAIEASTDFTIENIDGDSVTDIVPSTGVNGKDQTVIDSGLTISLAGTPSGDKTVVQGAQDVKVVGFNFEAAEGDDIELTNATVTVYVDEDSGGTFAVGEEGSTSARDRVASCTLVDRSTGSLVAGPESVDTDANGEIDFTNFSWTIAGGADEILDVVCNFADVAPGTADEFAFEIDAAGDLTAVEVTTGDSITVGGSFGINAAEATKVSVTGSGSLSVSVDSQSNDIDDFLVTGSSDNLVSIFRFDASDEDFRVENLTISEEAAGSDATTYSDNIESVTIEYPMEDGSTGTRTTGMVGNEAKFDNLDMYVEEGTPARVYVYVDVTETDRDASGEADSNDRVRMEISVDTTNDDQFEATGAASGSALDDDDVSATTTSEVFVVRETIPTFSLSANSPGSNSAVATSNMEVLRFNVAADANEDVVINKFTFTLNANDSTYTTAPWNACNDTDLATSAAMAPGKFNFYKLGNSTALDTADTDWTLFGTDGAVVTGCGTATVTAEVAIQYFGLTLPTAQVVPAGTTATYQVKINTTGLTTDDTLQVSLDEQTSVYSDTALDNSGAITATASTFTADATATAIQTGMVVCFDEDTDAACDSDEEQALVVGSSGTTVTLVRGYNGTTAQAIDDNSDILFRAGAVLWQDDGTTSVSTATEEYWGAYLVETLPVDGNGFGF